MTFKKRFHKPPTEKNLENLELVFAQVVQWVFNVGLFYVHVSYECGGRVRARVSTWPLLRYVQVGKRNIKCFVCFFYYLHIQEPHRRRDNLNNTQKIIIVNFLRFNCKCKLALFTVA